MDFSVGLLGPLLVRVDGSTVTVSGERQRRVLAVLALNAGRPVTTAGIAAGVWSEYTPRTVRGQIHTAVWQLRRALGRHGVDDLLLGDSDSYHLRVDPQVVDLHRFEALVVRGRRLAAAGRPVDAAGVLRGALRLWRGSALDGLTGASFDGEAARLEELRLSAIEDLVEWSPDSIDGRDGDVDLSRLHIRYPLRERLAGALMLVLHRAGRQAEALQVYHRTAAALAEELGIDPGRRLTDRYAAVLRRDDMLDPATQEAPDAQPIRPVPAELPLDARAFIGREAELARLDNVADESRGTVVVAAIVGTAGVGKTALAVHWAHRAVERFPDGQLYVDLRGYDPEQPVEPAAALAGFLRSLDVAAADIPESTAERAARYRTLLYGRRMLVVLDNASEAEQVRPLLPGSPSCVVLVTSRDSLAGLTAREGARRIDLDLLPPDDARSLLRMLVGRRIDAEPTAAMLLVEQCARLPLALRVAAELISSRPDASLTELTDELAGRHRRLERMEVSKDSRGAVRAVLSWSYRHLCHESATAFRRIGLHPGPDLDIAAAAALLDADADGARRLLRTLTAASLVYRTADQRFATHDLLRAYAAELAESTDAADLRRESLTRLFSYYLSASTAAVDLIHPGSGPGRPAFLPAETGVPPFIDAAAALRWMDAERPNLVSVCTHAAAHGWHHHATALAAVLARYLDLGGHFAEAFTVHKSARHAAREIADPDREAQALTDIGLAHWRQGDHAEAARHYQDALALSGASGDLLAQARAHTNLGILRGLQRRYRPAQDHLRKGLTIFSALDHSIGRTSTLVNLGLVHLYQACFEEAADAFQQAIVSYRAAGDRTGLASALTNLGLVHERQGRFETAVDHHRQALTHSESTGDRVGMGHALTNLGSVRARQGHHQEAIEHHRTALRLFQDAGHHSGAADALNGLATALRAAGRLPDAIETHHAALTLADRIGDRYEMARANDGLGEAHNAAGDRERARTHWTEALMILTDLDSPEAHQIEARLTTSR